MKRIAPQEIRLNMLPEPPRDEGSYRQYDRFLPLYWQCRRGDTEAGNVQKELFPENVLSYMHDKRL